MNWKDCYFEVKEVFLSTEQTPRHSAFNIVIPNKSYFSYDWKNYLTYEFYILGFPPNYFWYHDVQQSAIDFPIVCFSRTDQN